MRIAVVGAGVSGCLAARLLATEHEVILYEAGDHAGGHAHTVDVELDGKMHAVDVAFMVFNRRTYPNFSRMLDLLGVESRASDMSFSVRCSRTGLEYQGSGLRGLFAQRANAVSPSFLRMIGDILRFNRLGREAVADGSLKDGQAVDAFLKHCRVGPRFVEHYLTPMAAAIWSTKPSDVLAFPARFLIGFFNNHGLLQVRDRPVWRTLVGGSRQYVRPLLAAMSDRVRLGQRITSVQRLEDGVEIQTDSGPSERYDEVVLATHADQTLAILRQPTPAEGEILRAFPYQPNHALLHTDTSQLPRRRHAWASWNYHLPPDDRAATVTYDLTRLQGLATGTPLLLTLNEPEAVDPSKVLREFNFTHPAYSIESIAAQLRWSEISGRDRIHYAGAYWGYSFHEDGVNSALAVARHFGIDLDACKAACITAPSPTTAASR